MRKITLIFDWLHLYWEEAGTERAIGLAILWIYLCTILAMEANRLGFYPAWLPTPPSGHYFSIQLAFTLILGLEVLSLIFILPASLSRGIGKQLEILTLILLRNAFKELSTLPEPISVNMSNLEQIIDIAVSGAGALGVFVCLGFYRRIARRRNYIRHPEMISHYVQAKKLLSLCLLAIFAGIAGHDLYLAAWKGIHSNFFETIYTVLIFADIAMVLISQRYMPCYYAVFRNSGFVIGTLMMRLSLSAPPLLCSAIALFAALYVLALTWGTNQFTPPSADDAPQ